MKLFGEEYDVELGELIWGIGAGIGGLATIHRFEKCIRPKSRFVLAEIGIKFLEVAVGLACLDLGSKYGRTVDAGHAKSKARHEKEKGKEVKEDNLVKDFSEWIKKKEKEEEDNLAETFSQVFGKDIREKVEGDVGDGNE